MNYPLEKFEQFCLENGLFQNNSRFLIGFSGGADSLAMLMLFLEMQKKYHLFLMAAHVNYHLRANESDLDEQFVRNYCSKKNIPHYILQTKIHEHESVQLRAREIRINYFQKLSAVYKMDFIALAHHQQDQAETVLQRFLRGSGFSGLKGIKPISGNIIHPLLCFTKSELIDYLNQNQQDYRTDQSNFSLSYNRNKLRNELLPHLQKEYNKNIENRLVEYSHFFASADSYFIDFAKQELKKVVLYKNEYKVVFDVGELLNAHPIVKYYIFREAILHLTSIDKDFYRVHFQDLLHLLTTQKGYKEIGLPNNVYVYKDYDQLVFHNKGKHLFGETDNKKELNKLTKYFTFNNQRFQMQKLKLYPTEGLGNGQTNVVMDFDQIKFPLTLRYKENGDKFFPLGMTDYKKLKKFFIDEKIPKLQRDSIIIITDIEKIIWVCGYRIDQRVAVTTKTKNFLSISTNKEQEYKNRSLDRKVRNR